MEALAQVLKPDMTPDAAAGGVLPMRRPWPTRRSGTPASRGSRRAGHGHDAGVRRQPGGTAQWSLNVGDSRAYHITGEGITRITRDHSLVEDMVERGDITEDEARTSSPAAT